MEDADDDDLGFPLGECDRVAIPSHDGAAERPAQMSMRRRALTNRIEAIPNAALEVVGLRGVPRAVPRDGFD